MLHSLEADVTHLRRVLAPRSLGEVVVEVVGRDDARGSPRILIDVVEIEVEDAAVPQLQKLFVLLRRDEARAAAASREQPHSAVVEPGHGSLPVEGVPAAVCKLRPWLDFLRRRPLREARARRERSRPLAHKLQPLPARRTLQNRLVLLRLSVRVLSALGLSSLGSLSSPARSSLLHLIVVRNQIKVVVRTPSRIDRTSAA
mmetsp:Transcript_1600/g.5855  ORF Transcript_1600/g.5855 Transcript_1600/m.5855 type:complete len:201 (-) Transcript_1600:143-745(-)